MTTTEELPIPKEYHEASIRFRWAWLDYLDKEKEVKNEIVFMVKILEDEGYSRTKAIQKIVQDHKDLRGFSSRTIYRELPDNMKQSHSQRDLKQYRQQDQKDESSLEVPNKDDGLPNDKYESINKTTTYDLKNAQTLSEEKETELRETSILEVDLPPPEPELKDPKVTAFVGQLPKSVLRLAEKIELAQSKLELIANYSNKSILKDHRSLQEKLVKETAPLTIDQAKVEISQTIRDLETGAIQKIEGQNSYILNFDLREKIPKKPDRIKQPLDYFLQFQTKTFPEMMYLLTGHKLNEDESCYEPNHVDNTEKHRQEIVNVLYEGQKNSLYENAELLSDALISLMDIINGGSTTKL